MKRTHSRLQGFTLVELLIVIVIIAILAAITVVAYNGVQQRARDSKRREDVSTLQKAIEMYHIDNGGYPNCGGGTYQPGGARVMCTTNDAGFVADLVPKYINAVPKDPINSGDYQYRYGAGSKRAADASYAATSGDDYLIGVSLESQGGPYVTSWDAGSGTKYNMLFGN